MILTQIFFGVLHSQHSVFTESNRFGSDLQVLSSRGGRSRLTFTNQVSVESRKQIVRVLPTSKDVTFLYRMTYSLIGKPIVHPVLLTEQRCDAVSHTFSYHWREGEEITAVLAKNLLSDDIGRLSMQWSS